MIHCIIVDDEPLARQILEQYIQSSPVLKLVYSCENALDALEIISKYKVDLMFLDIKMPRINGMDFAQNLKNPPAIIFTTAFQEYAVKSYELEAIDYLLKPITFERFSKSIAKFQRVLEPEPSANFVFFKVDGRLVKVQYADIITVQSIKDYLIIKTQDKSYITHMTMKYLVDLLPANQFRQVHRSYMVSIAHITAIGTSEMALGSTIVPIGKSFKNNLSDIS